MDENNFFPDSRDRVYVQTDFDLLLALRERELWNNNIQAEGVGEGQAGERQEVDGEREGAERRKEIVFPGLTIDPAWGMRTIAGTMNSNRLQRDSLD